MKKLEVKVVKGDNFFVLCQFLQRKQQGHECSSVNLDQNYEPFNSQNIQVSFQTQR
jgi:hypothetical protein